METQPKPSFFRKVKKFFLKFTIIVILIVIAVMYFVSHYHYSEGSRTGYLSKFSKKGYVFKTYEGELYVGGANADNSTLVNNNWPFSVRKNDQSAIDSLKKYEGHVVKLHYYKVIKGFFYQGDQDYFVHKVEFIREK